MRPRILQFLTLCFLIATPLVSPWTNPSWARERDVRGDLSLNNFSRYGEASLEFDKTLYDPGEDVWVRFRIRNRGYRVIRVYPAMIESRTFQFMATDRRNRELPRVYRDRSHREQGRTVVNTVGDHVKEIILHPGESFVKKIALNDYYDFRPGKEYRIVGYFYPDYRRKFFARTKNTLRLRIARVRDRSPRGDGEEEYYTDSLPGLSPAETVYLFLSAEMRRNWKNYLKFLDIRKYIISYDRFASRYARASETLRPLILREFSRYLTSLPADRLARFKILETRFERDRRGEIRGGGRAFVVVRAERSSKGFQTIYNYRFTLEKSRRRSGFWKIVYVTASVIR